MKTLECQHRLINRWKICLKHVSYDSYLHFVSYSSRRLVMITRDPNLTRTPQHQAIPEAGAVPTKLTILNSCNIFMCLIKS